MRRRALQKARKPESQRHYAHDYRGEMLYERDPDLCCRLRKVEPLSESLVGYDAWIAALRRDQSPTRANIGIIEWNARHNLVKINPLAKWARRDVWDYIVKNELPYNPLYDEG